MTKAANPFRYLHLRHLITARKKEMIDSLLDWSTHMRGRSTPVFLGIMSGLRMLGAVGAFLDWSSQGDHTIHHTLLHIGDMLTGGWPTPDGRGLFFYSIGRQGSLNVKVYARMCKIR